MKTRFNLLALLVLFATMVLSACGAGAAAPAAAATGAPAKPAAQEVYAAQPAGADNSGAASVAKGGAPAPQADQSAAPANSTGDTTNASADSQNAAYSASHMIVKNGNIKLLVADTDIAIDRATQTIGDVSGYIVSSRVWYQPYADGKNYKYATITIGVPVDQFESALNRLRALAVKVEDENASGEDVTNQYVDLQSQITNLEATRDRIKAFLDSAKTVDEALRINTELTNVEAQIEQIKGQMNYLKDRSAYSTITINLEPVLPELVATPTSTPMPTATPIAWKPGETFKDAKKAVTYAYQGIIDFLIWIFVVFVPIFAPPLLIVWGLWKFFTRKPKNPNQ